MSKAAARPERRLLSTHCFVVPGLFCGCVSFLHLCKRLIHCVRLVAVYTVCTSLHTPLQRFMLVDALRNVCLAVFCCAGFESCRFDPGLRTKENKRVEESVCVYACDRAYLTHSGKACRGLAHNLFLLLLSILKHYSLLFELRVPMPFLNPQGPQCCAQQENENMHARTVMNCAPVTADLCFNCHRAAPTCTTDGNMCLRASSVLRRKQCNKIMQDEIL